MRIAPVLAAFVLGAACASAQPEPTAGQARRLLQSQSLLNKAWGAWYAGASHNPALREPLLAALRRARSLSGSARDSKAYAYVQALFDALIQIPGVVPSEVILPFEANWRPEILILLSRDPRGAENDLLAMRDNAGLEGCRTVGVNDQSIRVHTLLIEQFPQIFAGVIVSQYAEDEDRRAQSTEVACDIGGAAGEE